MVNQFRILGMHCQACQKVIEKKLSKIAGVSGVIANLNGDVSVTADHTITAMEIDTALEGTDYQVNQN